MPPILINTRDLIKLGFISVLTIVLSFAAGFLFGLQQSSMNIEYQTNGEYQPLPSPAKSSGLDELAKMSSPKVADATHGNKVDNKAGNSAKPDDVSIEPVKKPLRQTAEKQKEKTVAAKATLNVENKKPNKAKTVVADKKNAPASISKKDTHENNQKIKYSVQIAVYGSLNNAEKMMKKLQAKNIDAYVTDYINKKNKKRFNVRFGYFENKKTALKALDNYRKTQKSDGYLVNFSAKNIVDLAKAEPENKRQVLRIETVINPGNAQPAKRASQKNHVPADVVAGDAVPAEAVKISDELKKAQDTIPAY